MKFEPRTARISPDRPIVGIAVIVLVSIIMIAGYIFSFAAIADAAMWAGLPASAAWVRFTAPIFIDGAIVTYTAAYAVHQWRSERAHAMYARRVLYFVTFVSVMINAAHALSFWGWSFDKYEVWGGTLIAVMAPVASLFSAEQMIKLVFEQGEPQVAAPVEVQAEDGFELSEPSMEELAEELGVSLTPEPATLEHEPTPRTYPLEIMEEPVTIVPDHPLEVDENGLFIIPQVQAA